jgi:hypothetical protein
VPASYLIPAAGASFKNSAANQHCNVPSEWKRAEKAKDVSAPEEDTTQKDGSSDESYRHRTPGNISQTDSTTGATLLLL